MLTREVHVRVLNRSPFRLLVTIRQMPPNLSGREQWELEIAEDTSAEYPNVTTASL